MTGLRSAQSYAEAGFAVLPMARAAKRPLIPWAEYRRRRPRTDEITRWWHQYPDAGVALVCGKVSAVVVLDEDPRHGGDASLAGYPLPRGPVVLSGGGGRHFYFALSGEVVPTIGALLPGVDLLGEGALATAPPSSHPSGKRYQWAPGQALGDVPLPAVPSWLRRLIRAHEEQRRTARDGASRGGAESADLDDVLARLRGVRRAGHGWMACCPAHEDHDPSLSIALGTAGRLLLHCFGGCPYHVVRDALTARAVA